MVSIRVKLFSKRKKKKDNRGPVINSLEQLGSEELRSKILSGDSSTPKSSNNNRKATYNAPTSKNNKFKELVDKYKNDPDFKKKVKTGGFITLGTALTAGAAIGGAKLIKNRKNKKNNEENNEKVKNSILLDNDKE